MKNKKTILFSLLILIIVLTACESEQPGFLIVEKQGTTITTSITNNITNNITNAGSNITNNITNNYTLGNTSFSCNDANDYLYNVSVLNGQLTGLCAADSTGNANSYSILLDAQYNITNQIWLNLTDQRYNDTALINAVNNSVIHTTGDETKTGTLTLPKLILTTYDPNPIIYADADTNTGIAFIAPDVLNLYAGGIKYIEVTSLGVGINGYTSMNYLFTVNGSSYLEGDVLVKGVLNTSIIYENNISLNVKYNDTAIINTIANNLQTNITSVNTSSVQKTDFNTQNTSTWTAINNKQPLFTNSSTQCTGTDKLINITSLNGIITGTCATDQTGGGSSQQIALPNRQSTYMVYATEMLSRAQVAAQDPFTMGAISSGTTAARNGNRTHPGIVGFLTSTTASSGYYISTDNTAFLINGSESFTAVLSIPVKTGNVSITYAGYMDVISAAVPTDGVFFNITNLTVRGTARNNGVPALTQTNYNLTANAWYIFTFNINNSLYVNFTIKNETGSVLWSNNISNIAIPNVVGRETGAGITSYTVGGTTAQNLINIDYLEIAFNTTLYR